MIALLKNVSRCSASRRCGLTGKAQRGKIVSLTRELSTSSVNTLDETKKTALVVGSSGATGSIIARHLSQDVGMQVLGADVAELPPDLFDWELDGFMPLPSPATLPELTLSLVRGIHYFLQNDGMLDALIVAAGGWQGDPSFATRSQASDMDHLGMDERETGALEYASTVESMMKMNFDPVVAANFVAQHFMAPNGLYCAIGATAALGPTPGMLGYGLSKVGAHHAMQTLGACTDHSLDTKAVRKAGRLARQQNQMSENVTSLHVLTILPTKIDTPNNRKFEPDGDFSAWTKPQHIAAEIGKWIRRPPLRPHSGALIKVHPNKAGDGADFEMVR